MSQINKLKSDSEYSREANVKRYNNSWLYYRMKRPEVNKQLISKYVEPVLKEAVDKMMPPLLNIFTESDSEAVIFRGKGFKSDEVVTNAINQTINRIFLRENDGYQILTNAFKEALITGDSFIKYYIEEDYVEDKIKIADWTPIIELQEPLTEYSDTEPLWISKPSGAKKGLEWKTVDGMILLKGKLNLLKINKNLVIEQVDLKDLYFDDSMGSDFKRSRYLSHRITTTVGECINMGYSEEDFEGVDTVNTYSDSMSKQRLINDGTMGSDSTFDVVVEDPYERKINLWEHYLYSSIPEGKTKLYQVTATDNSILSVNEITRIPFVHGTFETVPGSFWGGSMFDICAPFQDEISNRKRMLHQVLGISALGRYQAVKGQYDRESLLNNRPGAVIEVNAPGAVSPFQQFPLPTGLMEDLTMTMQTKDNIISTSVGSTMTPDGLPQVAASTVAMVLTNEQLKDKVVAKNLARTLIAPLYEGIYELLRSEGYEIEMEDGSIITADSFPSSYEFIIDINTQDDDAAQASQIANVAQMIAQLSQVPSEVMTPQNLFNISQRLLKQVDIENSNEYFSDPSLNQPSPEEMQAQMEKAALDKEMTMISMEKLKAETFLLTSQVAKAEIENKELIKNNEAKRKREEEKSLREFQELELDKEVKIIDAKTKELRAQTNAKAVDAEILGFKSGRPVNITGVSS